MSARGATVFPAEWEPQAGVMLAWPHADTDWGGALERTLPVFDRIGCAVSRDEPLLSVCRDRRHLDQVAQRLHTAGACADHLCFALADSNDTWARDHGAVTTLRDGIPVLNDFRFDGWGGKFAADLDDAITAELHQQGCFGESALTRHPLVLEGGAIETDGQGTLLATRSSVLDPRRNPRLSAARIEQMLRDTLGVKRFLWLDHGRLSGDDTDAHIDVLARFADPHTILYAQAPPGDPDHAALQAMHSQLECFRTQDGAPYRLRALPFPGQHIAADGRRLAAGYANFLITNGSVLLPTFGVEADQAAAELLQDCFPGRRVVGIDCRPLIEQNGSLHCLTMQFPAALPLRNTIEAVA